MAREIVGRVLDISTVADTVSLLLDVAPLDASLTVNSVGNFAILDPRQNYIGYADLETGEVRIFADEA